MQITLQCSKCGDKEPLLFAQLYDAWKRAYDSLEEEEDRVEAEVKADVRCHCGNKDSFDGPMFDYTFQLVFDELIREAT